MRAPVRPILKVCVLAVTAALACAVPARALTLSKSIDRKFPTSTVCPLPDRGAESELRFIADSAAVRITLGRSDTRGRCSNDDAVMCSSNAQCPGSFCIISSTFISRAAVLPLSSYNLAVDPDADGVPNVLSPTCYNGCHPVSSPGLCAAQVPAASLPSGSGAFGYFLDDAIGSCPAGWTCSNTSVQLAASVRALKLGVTPSGAASGAVNVGGLQPGVGYVLYLEWFVDQMANEGDSTLSVTVESVPPILPVPEICGDGLDNDGDGLLDLADSTCGPATPLDPDFLDSSTLSWSSVPQASSYAVYRGTIRLAGAPNSGQRCQLSELPTPDATLDETPMVGEAFFYLVAAQQYIPSMGVMSETSLGTGSSGASRDAGTRIPCGLRLFVDPDAAGSENGRSWQNAYTTIGAALNHPMVTSRAVEVWTKGTVTDTPVNMTARLQAIIRGGFAGDETQEWQRDVLAHPTTIDGVLFMAGGQGLMMDGVTLTGSVKGNGMAYLELTRASLTPAFFNGNMLELRPDTAGPLYSGPRELWIDQSSFTQAGLVFQVDPGLGLGRITRSSFNMGNVQLDIGNRCTDGGSSSVHLDMTNNEFRGSSRISIFAMAKGLSGGEYEGLLASNLFAGTGSRNSAISMSTEWRTVCFDIYPPQPGVSAMVNATVTGNTVSGWGREALRCSASTQEQFGPAGPEDRAVCSLRAWDNLLVGNATGIELSRRYNGDPCSANDPQCSAVVDIEAVGNDLFGNTVAPLIIDQVPWLDIDSINLIPGFSENFILDPLFMGAGDFRLQPGSPAIDRGHPQAPGLTMMDVAGNPRGQDGDGDGQAKPDVGAYEK